MNPTREEIVGWLREAAAMGRGNSQLFLSRAAQLEQSTTDPLLKQMAEVLERVSEDGRALLSMTIGSRNSVLQALQAYRDREKTDADE